MSTDAQNSQRLYLKNRATGHSPMMALAKAQIALETVTAFRLWRAKGVK